MLELFKEGGWGMWVILVFGGVLLGASIAYAIKPERRRLGFIVAMGVTTLLGTVHATWTCFGAVFHAMSDSKIVPDAEFQRTLMEGFKESTRPGSFGGFVLTLAALLVAVGVLRANRREE